MVVVVVVVVVLMEVVGVVVQTANFAESRLLLVLLLLQLGRVLDYVLLDGGLDGGRWRGLLLLFELRGLGLEVEKVAGRVVVVELREGQLMSGGGWWSLRWHRGRSGKMGAEGGVPVEGLVGSRGTDDDAGRIVDADGHDGGRVIWR